MVIHLTNERDKAHQTIQDTNTVLQGYVTKRVANPEDLLPPLTTLQSKVLEFLVTCKCFGQSPTFAEIQAHMNMKNRNSAVFQVDALCKKGYVNKSKGVWRSMIPVFNSNRERV